VERGGAAAEDEGRGQMGCRDLPELRVIPINLNLR
jgi:hypothetical protein